MSDGAFTPLGNYPSLILAEVAKSRLSLNRIHAEIFDSELANLYTNALGGVTLSVKPEDYAAARALLDSEEPLDDTVVSDEDLISETSLYCPRCHSKDVELQRQDPARRGFSFARLFRKWLGLEKDLRCRHCGNKWMD